jgi:hypothetical protein
MSELYVFLQRTRSWYGAVELVRSYRPNMRRGLLVSILLHALALGLYWEFVYTKPPENEEHVVRITTYEELAVIPSIGQSEFGLKQYPVVVQATESGDEKLDRKSPASKGVVIRRPGSRPRAMGNGIGDLPSVLPNDKVNANSLAPVEPTSTWDRNDAVGGSNGNPLNNVKGGNVVTGRDGNVPSGPASSGIGSAAKPAPGLYGTGGHGGTDFYGNGEGGGIGYSMKWLAGGTRRKVAGQLPKYPEGSRVEAEIRLYAVVSPGGLIEALHPVEKADSRLEDAALKEVRYWKFEPLKPSQPQVNQTCEITFLFTLK